MTKGIRIKPISLYSQTSIIRNARDRIESFRIIGSSNDQDRGVLDIFGKAWMLIEFATSTRIFREVIGTSVKALKRMSFLEAVASSSPMHCRYKNVENKRKSELLIHLYNNENKD